MSTEANTNNPQRVRVTPVTLALATLLLVSAGLNIYTLVRFSAISTVAKSATETANNAQWRLDVICANVPNICKHP